MPAIEARRILPRMPLFVAWRNSMQQSETSSDNNKTMPAWFARLVAAMFELYPQSKLTEATIPAWWMHLRHLRQPILADAFRRAVATNPVFPPSAQAIRDIGDEELDEEKKAERQREAERMRDHMLEPARSTDVRDTILQAFYAACDRAERQLGSRKVTMDDEPVLGGLITLLHRYLGGNDEQENALCGRWFTSDMQQRGFDADAVVRGVRKAPRYCRAIPTLMVLQYLIRGEPMVGWPESLVDPNGRAHEERCGVAV
jgi:hypothetical protein